MLAIVPSKDKEDEIIYPVRDGKPVAETEFHFREIFTLVLMLDRFFKDRPDVYVCGNNFVYFEKGKPKSCFAPDAYVVFGVPKRKRDCFQSWIKGVRVPSIVFEVTSKTSRNEDEGDKRLKCAKAGVEEYFMYDPRAEYLQPALQGFRLMGGVYIPILPDALGHLHSQTLNLDLCLDDTGLLKLIERKTGKALLRYTEYETQITVEKRARRVAETAARREIKAREKAEEARQIAEEARLEAEAQLAKLRDELKQLKNG